MSLFSMRSRGRMAVCACALMASLLSAQHAQASSADEWEKFQRNVEHACLAAAKGVLQVKNIQVDPYGSESYGFALLSGVENGTSDERLVACAYGKQSQVAEISSTFGGPANVASPESSTTAGPMLTMAFGDIHIVTFDGVRYGFQTPGDFLLMSNADRTFQFQTRTVPYLDWIGTSVMEAVAVIADGHLIEIYFSDRAVYINGEALDVSKAYGPERERIMHSIPNGPTLSVVSFATSTTRRAVQYQVHRYGDKHPLRDTKLPIQIIHNPGEPRVSSVMAPVDKSDPWVLGLNGIADGDPSNDVISRNGEILTLPAPRAEVERIGVTWRVTPEESGFVTRPAAPVAEAPPAVELATLPVEVRTEAAITCATSGVTDLHLLRDCTYDVAATGDKSFAVTAADIQIHQDENPDPREPMPATGLSPVYEIGEEAVSKALAAAEKVAASPTLEPAKAPSPRERNVTQRVVTAEPAARAAEPEVDAAAPQAPAVDIPPVELPRGERLTQNGHYLVFQEDGNLCVYREADDGWVWCINNDPAVRYAETVRVRTTNAGQLIGQDADGVVLYALPSETPFTPVGIRLSTEGALEVYSADGVLWSSAE